MTKLYFNASGHGERCGVLLEILSMKSSRQLANIGPVEGMIGTAPIQKTWPNIGLFHSPSPSDEGGSWKIAACRPVPAVTRSIAVLNAIRII